MDLKTCDTTLVWRKLVSGRIKTSMSVIGRGYNASSVLSHTQNLRQIIALPIDIAVSTKEYSDSSHSSLQLRSHLCSNPLRADESLKRIWCEWRTAKALDTLIWRPCMLGRRQLVQRSRKVNVETPRFDLVQTQRLSGGCCNIFGSCNNPGLTRKTSHLEKRNTTAVGDDDSRK